MRPPISAKSSVNVLPHTLCPIFSDTIFSSTKISLSSMVNCQLGTSVCYRAKLKIQSTVLNGRIKNIMIFYEIKNKNY